MSSAGRLLGEAAVQLGRPDDAYSLFIQALQVCRRAGYRAEVGLIELDLADLSLRFRPLHHQKGIEYLDSAATALKAMGMRRDLDRARALRQSADDA